MLDKANAANEARYQQILSGYDDLHGRVMGDLANVGAQERADIDREYRNMGSDVYQRMVNRGFANSSLPATMQMGVTRERAASRARLASQLAQQRAGLDASISQGKFGVMERRTDEAPDANQLIALSQAAGRAGVGTGMAIPGGTIGISPMAYQNMYQQQLMRHFAPMMMMGSVPYRPIRANQRAQETRLRRAAYKNANAAYAPASRGVQNAQMLDKYMGYGPYANVG